jgi:hypothetical protein
MMDRPDRPQKQKKAPPVTLSEGLEKKLLLATQKQKKSEWIHYPVIAMASTFLVDIVISMFVLTFDSDENDFSVPCVVF